MCSRWFASVGPSGQVANSSSRWFTFDGLSGQVSNFDFLWLVFGRCFWPSRQSTGKPTLLSYKVFRNYSILLSKIHCFVLPFPFLINCLVKPFPFLSKYSSIRSSEIMVSLIRQCFCRQNIANKINQQTHPLTILGQQQYVAQNLKFSSFLSQKGKG
jgi:hypothetical protein